MKLQWRQGRFGNWRALGTRNRRYLVERDPARGVSTLYINRGDGHGDVALEEHQHDSAAMAEAQRLENKL